MSAVTADGSDTPSSHARQGLGSGHGAAATDGETAPLCRLRLDTLGDGILRTSGRVNWIRVPGPRAASVASQSGLSGEWMAMCPPRSRTTRDTKSCGEALVRHRTRVSLSLLSPLTKPMPSPPLSMQTPRWSTDSCTPRGMPRPVSSTANVTAAFDGSGGSTSSTVIWTWTAPFFVNCRG